MARRWLLGLLLALGVLLVVPREAEARRRGIPIPIPGPGSEQLVKVAELPRIPDLRRADSRYIDLGYKFNSSVGGAWVGWLSPTQYIALEPDDLEALLQVAGLPGLPPVPERASDTGSLLWIGLALLALLGLAAKWWFARRGSGATAPDADPAAATGRMQQALDEAIDSRRKPPARRTLAGIGARRAEASPAAYGIGPRGISATPVAGRSAFGRR